LENTIDRLPEDADKYPQKQKQLARKLAIDIATEKTPRPLLLEGLLRDVATKQDLRELEERLERQIEELRREIHRLDERMDSLVKWMIGLLASIWLTLIALLLPLVLKAIH